MVNGRRGCWFLFTLAGVAACGGRSDLEFEDPLALLPGTPQTEVTPLSPVPVEQTVSSPPLTSTTQTAVAPSAAPPQAEQPTASNPPIVPSMESEPAIIVVPDSPIQPPAMAPVTAVGTSTGLACGPTGDLQSQPPLRVSIPEPNGDPDASQCGNATVEGLEQCDDGNRANGDGCGSSCYVEPNFLCIAPGDPCLFTGLCGDGQLDLLEQCDDGNRAGADGCSANCQVEAHHVCPYPGEPCRLGASCGDGLVMGAEQCDAAGNVPGCWECELQAGWVCPEGRSCFAVCGDGILVEDERCDDGNQNLNDGCSDTCQVEWDGCDGEVGGCAQSASDCADGQCTSVCGDGRLETDEACDDGNSRDRDGCSETCLVEFGYTCRVAVVTDMSEPRSDAGAPNGNELASLDAGAASTLANAREVSVCTSRCGDGYRTFDEQCDLASRNTVDGECLPDCRLGMYCGDGEINQQEECDDGRNVTPYAALGAQGCAPGCKLPAYCGDGIVQAAFDEECDVGAGNIGSYGGCTATCKLAPRCGDGVVDECGNEVCDDGNVVSLDGCSALCQREPLF